MAYEKNDRRPNRKGRKKVCAFCVDKVECIDYKDTAKLHKYISDRAKILPRRVTGNCAAGEHRHDVVFGTLLQLSVQVYHEYRVVSNVLCGT